MEFFSSHKTYDFMKYSKLLIAITVSLAIASMVLLFTKGLSYGIDFAGGTVVQVKYDKKAPIDQIRTELGKDETFHGLIISEFGSPDEIQIRFMTTTEGVSEDVGDLVRSRLKGTGNFEIRKVDIVGPKVGSELREKGLMAVFFSMIGILVYVAFRFEWNFALSAIIALVHDVFITLGILIIFKVEMSLDVLAALLTLVGYSINDTIIIYDRMREELREGKETNLMKLINSSVSKTLSRTVLTVLTVFFVVFTLYAFGGDIIHGFSFTMLVGLIIGSYSSIFISAPLLSVFGFNIEAYKAKQAQKLKTKLEKEKMRAQFESGVM